MDKSDNELSSSVSKGTIVHGYVEDGWVRSSQFHSKSVEE